MEITINANLNYPSFEVWDYDYDLAEFQGGTEVNIKSAQYMRMTPAGQWSDVTEAIQRHDRIYKTGLQDKLDESLRERIYDEI